jgi:hypothetical protein
MRVGLSVSWHAATGQVSHYVVRILLHDGRGPLYLTSPRTPSVFLGKFPAVDFGRVLVAAQSIDGHLGKARTAGLQAQPRRHCRGDAPAGGRCASYRLASFSASRSCSSISSRPASQKPGSVRSMPTMAASSSGGSDPPAASSCR